MILVTLGTFPTEFTRPLIAIDALCRSGILQEEVIVQCGHTSFESTYLTMRPFIAPDELTGLTKNARLIITHAGTGSLIKAIKLHKKIIAIARLSKNEEMVDDHQVEILNEFSKLNYILPWAENVPLENILEKVDDFEPNHYVSKKQNIINYLSEYIDSL